MTMYPPAGILTFFFTDLEDSTRLWEAHPEEMRAALGRHDELLKAAVETHGGHYVKTTGDGVHAVFENPGNALRTALAVQKAVLSEPWPDEIGSLKVRIGLHAGESEARGGDFYGPEVNLAARVMNLAHGGQVLLSAVTASLAGKTLPQGCSLADLGEHRLKGIAEAVSVFQLCHPDLPVDFPPLKSFSALKHTLPRQLTRFIGREKELADVKRLLGENRLVTLLGPGGTGKTRLMLQVGEEMIEGYSDGVWLVELAPLTDPDLIPERVAAALKIQEQPGREIRESIIDFLRRKQVLLLLDNVEHVVRESAVFAEYVLRHCPILRVLVTGREALFIGGEITLQIPSLSLPETAQGNDLLAQMALCESVQLFVERARAVRPDFKLDESNAPALADLVRRLDGIPLALELAAARLRMLTVEKIAERLNDRFRLLTGGSRTALPRQQTLQALIDWSWKLLEDQEQTLLRRLSVFSGGWSLEAAESVCGFEPLDAYEVFDGLDQLINKSLVTVEYLPDGEPRYSMLESIRQFSRDQLFEAGEGETLRGRHAEYYVAQNEKAIEFLSGPDLMKWVSVLRRELDNQRAVIAWTLEDRPDLAVRLVGVLAYEQGFWMSVREAHTWLTDAVNSARGPFEAGSGSIRPADFIRALIALGSTKSLLGDSPGAIEAGEESIRLAREHGENHLLIYGTSLSFYALGYADIEQAAKRAEEAVRLAREIDDRVGLSYTLLIFGGIRMLTGNPAQGEPLVLEGKRLVAELGNQRALARALEMEGHVHLLKRELAEASKYYLQAIDLFREIGDPRRIVMNSSYVAHNLRRMGRLEEARTWYRENILAWQEIGHRPAVAHQLECFAMLALADHADERAARLVGAAKAIRTRWNAFSSAPNEIAEMKETLRVLAERLGEAESEHLIAEGELISPDEAVDLALSS